MFDFKWMPVMKGILFDQLSYTQKQIINHFEYHTELSTKDLLFKNLTNYAELNKLNVFDYLPLTFVVNVDLQTYSPDFEKFSRCYDIFQTAINEIDKNIPDYDNQCIKLINNKLQQIGLFKEIGRAHV